MMRMGIRCDQNSCKVSVCLKHRASPHPTIMRKTRPAPHHKSENRLHFKVFMSILLEVIRILIINARLRFHPFSVRVFDFNYFAYRVCEIDHLRMDIASGQNQMHERRFFVDNFQNLV